VSVAIPCGFPDKFRRGDPNEIERAWRNRVRPSFDFLGVQPDPRVGESWDGFDVP